MIEIYIIGSFLFLLITAISFVSLMIMIENISTEELRNKKYLKKRAENEKRIEKIRRSLND